MNATDTLLQMDGVTKVFVTDEVETHALGGIHLELRRGEYVSISGPSGCGKSTLLAILGLLDTPTDGKFMLNGRPVQDLKMSERARIRNREIGFIFQAFNLIGDLTVYENVELPLTYRGMPSLSASRRVHDALERVGMSHRVKHYPRSSPAVSSSVSPSPARWRRADHPAGGRADRKPRFGERRSRHGTAARTASRRRDHLHGDARSPLRALRRAVIHLFDGRIVEERWNWEPTNRSPA